MPDVMPKSMQIRFLGKHLKDAGVEPDTIDLEHEVDETLSFPENERIILGKYASKSEQQMYDSSMEGAISHEVEDIKSKMVSKSEVDRIINEKLKKLGSLKDQVQKAEVTVAQEPVKANVIKAIDTEIVKQKSLSERFKNLRGAGYKKYIQPRQEKKAEEKKAEMERKLADMKAKLEEQKKINVAIEQGKLTGTRQASRLFYKKETERQLQYKQLMPKTQGLKARLTALITGYQTTTNPALKQQLAIEIAKKRQELYIQQQVAQQTMNMQLQQARRQFLQKQQLEQYKQQMQQQPVQYQQVPVQYQQPRFAFNPMGPHPLARPIMRQPSTRQMPKQRKGKQPHFHQINPMTGRCNICGYKAMRLL